MSNSLWPHGLYSPCNSPGQNTGMGSLSLLQGIFPTQGLNPGLLHCKWILYQLSHQGSPRILEWVDYPFSSRSFQPRNWTRVSCTAGRFFTTWAMREAPVCCIWKNLSAMQETWVQSLGWEDPLENTTHFSILVWEIPWTEEPGRLQSIGLQRVGYDWATFTHRILGVN